MLVLVGATMLGGCQVWNSDSMGRLSTLLKIDKKLDTGVTGYHTPRQSEAHAAETEQAARKLDRLIEKRATPSDGAEPTTRPTDADLPAP